jgi:hypothetical protein
MDIGTARVDINDLLPPKLTREEVEIDGEHAFGIVRRGTFTMNVNWKN